MIPYLYAQTGHAGSIEAITITTNVKKNKKGGIGSFEKFKNEVERVQATGNVIITTLLDFYGLPTSFPNHSDDVQRIKEIEDGMADQIGSSDFIPYLQKHELEALMFSSEEVLHNAVDTKEQEEAVSAIIKAYTNPEDINNSPQTAPSKRLDSILDPYEKTVHGDLIFDDLTMEEILSQCPRFKEWVDKLVERLNLDQNK
ncbi:hypothetical protein HNR74_004547 [Flammeovirga kamogawensis]|nr:hypothetical protein [Flammeovirga kamogawensis]